MNTHSDFEKINNVGQMRNEKGFLSKKDHDAETIEKMYAAWFKAVTLTVILWTYGASNIGTFACRTIHATPKQAKVPKPGDSKIFRQMKVVSIFSLLFW